MKTTHKFEDSKIGARLGTSSQKSHGILFLRIFGINSGKILGVNLTQKKIN